MSTQPDKNQQIVEYIASLTQKLSQTFKQLNQMSLQFLKTINTNERQSRLGNRNLRDKQKDKSNIKDKNDDLNSNLIDQDQQQQPLNGLNPKKKLKTKNRIQQAQQQYIEQLPSQQKGPSIKSHKKTQQNPPKNLSQQKPQDKKKVPKPVSHKPKAPTSSFLLFFKQQQQSIAKSYPNYGVVQLTKVAAKCWNDLSVQDKEPYQKLFEIERKKYQQEMQKYRRDFPQEVKQKQLEKKEKKKKKAKQRREKESTAPKNSAVKQKPLNISNVTFSDPKYFTQAQYITPSGVKIQQVNKIQENEEVVEEQNNLLDMKNQQSGQLEEQMQEYSEQVNSLGEDI